MFPWNGKVFRTTDSLCGIHRSFPRIGLVMENLAVFFFIVNLNKPLKKQSSWQWFETLRWSSDVVILYQYDISRAFKNGLLGMLPGGDYWNYYFDQSLQFNPMLNSYL